jgi:hypothetical protein
MIQLILRLNTKNGVAHLPENKLAETMFANKRMFVGVKVLATNGNRTVFF